MVGAESGGGRRDGKAQSVRERALTEHPAIGYVVEEDDGVAAVGRASTAEAERAEVERLLQQGTGLVEDGDLGCVDYLDVVSPSDVAIGIGRAASATRKWIRHTVEAQV